MDGVGTPFFFLFLGRDIPQGNFLVAYYLFFSFLLGTWLT